MSRVQQLIALAALAPEDGILIHKPSNIFYLSGFRGEGLLLLGQRSQCIVTDFRYVEQAQQESPGFEVLSISTGKPHAAVAAEAFRAKGGRSLRYEDDEVTVRGFAALQAAFEGHDFAPLGGLPEQLRQIKEEGELALIRRACQVSSKAFDWLLGEVKPGIRERELAVKLENWMLLNGADAIAFSTIVASGPNGSLPHAVPGDRLLQQGDLITFDYGAKVGGYCSDMTRTVALGEPGEELRRIYGIVLEAQMACQEALAPGKRCSDIDQLARDIIGEAGYGDHFGHGLGHAVGIDIHEDPRLSRTCDVLLQPGHVVTVEPGIYLPGLGGVRIENSCVITQQGGESLVSAPRELLIL